MKTVNAFASFQNITDAGVGGKIYTAVNIHFRQSNS